MLAKILQKPIVWLLTLLIISRLIKPLCGETSSFLDNASVSSSSLSNTLSTTDNKHLIDNTYKSLLLTEPPDYTIVLIPSEPYISLKYYYWFRIDLGISRYVDTVFIVTYANNRSMIFGDN